MTFDTFNTLLLELVSSSAVGVAGQGANGVRRWFAICSRLEELIDHDEALGSSSSYHENKLGLALNRHDEVEEVWMGSNTTVCSQAVFMPVRTRTMEHRSVLLITSS